MFGPACGQRGRSTAVIGVAGQNHGGAVKLLGKHGAEQHVRPGGAAKGDPGPRPRQHSAVMPVGPANGEIGRRATIVTMSLQQSGQRFGGGVAPVRITGDQRRRRRKVSEKTLAFVACPRRSRWQFRLDLDDLATLWQPVKPVPDKRLFRRSASTAHGKNDKFHRMTPC